MRFSLDGIADEGLVSAMDIDPEQLPSVDELNRSGECRFAAPIHVEIRIFGRFDRFQLEGRLRAAVALTCCRCLKPFDQELVNDFRAVYVRGRPAGDRSQDPVELTEADLGVVFFEGGEIDVTELVQDQVVLALPMQPICSAGCKDLCPRCGVDRNRRGCLCEPETGANPFSVLKKRNA